MQFVDMLDNTAVGQRNILNNFGQSALPTVTWQIDPFGHSAFQGVMSSSLSGYKGIMWAREASDYKAISCANKTIERVWSPSNTLGNAAATFQGIFVDNCKSISECIESQGYLCSFRSVWLA
jgi:hypothetical protein